MTRRYTGADEAAISAELAADASRAREQELTRALRDYLYEMHAAGPREHSHWVMSLEWLNEVRKIDAGNVPAWLAYSTPETILGIPIEVRADGGAPHLEAAL